MMLKLVFCTESEQGVAQAIIRGKIDFEREPWPSISESAKSLVRQMLEPDAKLRLTAKQVLGMLAYVLLVILSDQFFISTLLPVAGMDFLLSQSLCSSLAIHTLMKILYFSGVMCSYLLSYL